MKARPHKAKQESSSLMTIIIWVKVQKTILESEMLIQPLWPQMSPRVTNEEIL